MGEELPVGRIKPPLEELSYPVIRSDAAVALSETTVSLPRGEVNIGELISETTGDTYHDPEEVIDAIEDVLAESEE